MIEIKTLKVEELEFTCRVSGNEQDELVIFLHGFPETSYMWREIMGKISSLGFYCVAPDMRGYSHGACPKGIKNYTITKLSEDILGIATLVKKNSFHLVGHDWGAGIGWNIVYNNKERIISWTGLSIPHARAFKNAIKLDKEQRKKSRYIMLFLIPVIPELILRMHDFKIFRRLWQHSRTDELENYLSVFRRKESLTAALNYYRANIGKGKNKSIGDIHVPTLFIWGKHDEAVGAFAAENNKNYIKSEYTFLDLDGGHWLIQSNYSEVETALIEHLLKNKSIPNKSYE